MIFPPFHQTQTQESKQAAAACCCKANEQASTLSRQSPPPTSHGVPRLSHSQSLCLLSTAPTPKKSRLSISLPQSTRSLRIPKQAPSTPLPPPPRPLELELPPASWVSLSSSRPQRGQGRHEDPRHEERTRLTQLTRATTTRTTGSQAQGPQKSAAPPDEALVDAEDSANMSQYMYTSFAPVPPILSRIESTRPKTATATLTNKSKQQQPHTAVGASAATTDTTTTTTTTTTPASATTTLSTTSTKPPAAAHAAAAPPTPSSSSSSFFSKANPADSSRIPSRQPSSNSSHFGQQQQHHHHHPATRLKHIRTSSSSSASRSSHETSLTPTSTILSTASPIDPRDLTSPASPKKHKHHHSLQETRAGADRTRIRVPARLRKESGTLSSYARHPLVPPTPSHIGLTPNELKHVAMLVDTDTSGRHLTAGKAGAIPFSRTDSLSSAAPSTASMSTRTMTSSDPTTNSFDASRPYCLRNGRTYLSDPSLAYPLPVDLSEIHRQSLRTLLLIQLFGSPICSTAFASKPPGRVLEVACGSGFWSQSCHRYFAQRGHPDIHFTGMDIGPMGQHAGDVSRDMKWRFMQHDIRNFPWPFADGEFDLVMVKDLSLVVTSPHALQNAIEEYHRILRPGGTVEFWDSDHQIRMLRPHAAPQSGNTEDTATVASLGAYPISAKTPLSAPLNNFLVEYNSWVHRALESRNLSPVPCTLIGPMLIQESEELTDIQSKRLAIPLSEVRWEREGVGGVVTKDGKSFINSGKGKGKDKPDEQKKTLTEAQAALRRTALMTVVQQIQSLEPILREVSGKSQDEWDGWLGKMMNDLMRENGTSWGECLEVGAWWARKRER
ncbi:methyltransferase domain-containing protein [Colletotrichum melonis]|uniref:Methyltransferase domain-containing protein n=1 Tax=Colletotrichum melonis TaxID=1209925 RepID=A0AAI9V8R9_9PEZI|nr:methyltransferase domain-containing protein [Colletotrichum melonis]